MLFTCEQVAPGHPDKLCDQISDQIVTDCLQHDRHSRVAVECMIKDNDVFICGEITSEHEPNYQELVENALLFAHVPNWKDVKVTTHISKQSNDIALGVDKKGAGDQGVVYGYATDETSKMLPLPFVLATSVLEDLTEKYRRELKDIYPPLLPDAKSQVTYDARKKRIDTFLVSIQHREDVHEKDVHQLVASAMKATASFYGQNTDFRVLVNPTGRFVNGGSFADTGLTGRKIICDTYGGAARHGGGAFSGKDPTKVDRSGAYMARKIAKDILRQGFAKRCEVQLAYVIGMKEPVSVAVECFGTNRVPKAYLVRWIQKHYDLTPEGMITFLTLRDVDYTETSTFGHFWRQWLPWEK